MPIVFIFPSWLKCDPKGHLQLIRSLISLLGLPPSAPWILQNKQNENPQISKQRAGSCGTEAPGLYSVELATVMGPSVPCVEGRFFLSVGTASPGRLLSWPLTAASPSSWPPRGFVFLATSSESSPYQVLPTNNFSTSATRGHPWCPILFCSLGRHCSTGTAPNPQLENQLQSSWPPELEAPAALLGGCGRNTSHSFLKIPQPRKPETADFSIRLFCHIKCSINHPVPPPVANEKFSSGQPKIWQRSLCCATRKKKV